MTDRSAGAQPLWPVGLVVLAMACFQLGASTAKGLFPLVGAPGATALRLGLAALILLGIGRPWRGGVARADLPALLAFGLALAGLNAFFFLAVQTIPLGIAVAVDFLGPLGVAVAYSRRWLDLVWVAVAASGILLLLPVGLGAAALDPRGLLFSGCAALCWAGYIVCGRAAAIRLSSGRATALGMSIAAIVILPFGIAHAGTALASPAVLPLALLVAVLSSALPNSLEMMAMTRLPPRVFGVLMSLEPGMGAFCGWLVLGERLAPREILAILLVIVASGGSTLTAAGATSSLPDIAPV